MTTTAETAQSGSVIESPPVANARSGAAGPPGVSTTSKPLAERHIPALDGVRGLAILAVMFVHLSWRPTGTIVDRAFTAVADCGWMGVDLFFVLSGFLITGILIDSKDNPHYFRSFYGRRALRILPLYYAFVTFFVVVLPLWHARTPDMQYLLAHQGWLWAHATNIWAARDGLNTIPYSVGVAWSLAIEEQFYLIWPFVVRRISTRALTRACVGIIAAAFALRLVIAGQWPAAAHALMPARMDAFALGGLVAILVRQPGGRQRLERLWLPIGACALATIVGMSIVRRDMETPDYSLGTIGYASADWLSVAILAAALTRAAGGFAGPVLRFFGRYSYAIYLLHLPVMIIVTPVTAWLIARPRIAGSQLGWMFVSMLIITGTTVALALVSRVLLEEPFLKLKRFFPYHA